MLLGRLSTARFLREHWQKQPLLVRGAFPGFADPITPDELAGLACEDGVESRLVRGKGRRWRVTWGPHPEAAFASLPERDWTLLVQEVNRWAPAVADLLEPFAFLPNVRVDDVMISYAVPGGSVGPHLDSYDVFLVQGRGTRRWQWNTERPRERGRAFVLGLDLRILERFTPDRDELLEPGDMLYLPPGFPHHGVAVTECLTYSIGFRAPSAGEAWTSFAARMAAGPAAARLLEDPPLTPAAEPGAIPPRLLAHARELVRSIDLTDDAIDRWFASHTTRLKPGHALEAPRRVPDWRRKGVRLARTEEGRWAFLPTKAEREGGALLLYVAGEEIPVPRTAAAFAKELCRTRRPEIPRSAAARALMERLLAMGALTLRRGS